MGRELRWYDYITINIGFLGLTTLAQTNGIVFPLLVQQFVGEEVKGSRLGSLRLWTLMVALLMQAVMGMLSDRSTSAWGRRRPFVLGGALGNLVLVTATGLAIGMDGMEGFWFLFCVAILQSVSSNTAQAAVQGLIPDLVPEGLRGRFAGIKALFEVPLPLILVSFSVARLVSAGRLWAGLLVALGVFLGAMALALLAREEAGGGPRPEMDWRPILRLALMTGCFTALILLSGAVVRAVGQGLAGGGSIAQQMAVMGLVGLGGMVLAVALGVWVSVRLSIGAEAARRRPAFTWWVVNRLAFMVGTTNLSAFAVYFIQGRLGLERERAAGPAAMLMLAVGLFILATAIPGGWLSDRFGRKPVVAASGLLAAAGTFLAVASPDLPLLYAGGCVVGIATGLFFAANWALGTDIVPKSEAGRYLGISNLAGAGAGAVGAYIGGPIADFFTAQAPHVAGLGYVLIFVLYGLMFLFSALVLPFVRVEESWTTTGTDMADTRTGPVAG